MYQSAFLFEISDKIFSVGWLYIIFTVMGLIGLAKSFWHWWIRVLLVDSAASRFYQYAISEMKDLYVYVVHELGTDYILHS